MKPWMEMVRQLVFMVEYFDMHEWVDLGSVSEVRELLKDNPSFLPSSPGVYTIVYSDYDYIGRAIRRGGLRRRIKEHLRVSDAMWNDPHYIDLFHVKIISMKGILYGRLMARIVESVLISFHKPTLNRNGKLG